MRDQVIQKEADKLRRAVLSDVQRRKPNATGAIFYLDPRFASDYLGYEYRQVPDLDMAIGLADSPNAIRRAVIAGVLDQANRVIMISAKFPAPEQRFTGLHEIGHAMMHPNTKELHRDRPIDPCTPRPFHERQADEFAAEYLMPEKWFKVRLREIFGEVPVPVNEEFLWRLDPLDEERFFYYRSKKDQTLSLALAIANYNVSGFLSIKDQFYVSSKAVAFRLIELDLIDNRLAG